MLNNGIEKLTNGAKRITFSIRRLFPSYLLCFLPFLVFGSQPDIRLMLWKIAVVGGGLLVFHFVRKSMFPYIDLRVSFEKAAGADEKNSRLAAALVALSQSIVIAALAVAILLSMAGGI
jgi:hypothetical protein